MVRLAGVGGRSVPARDRRQGLARPRCLLALSLLLGLLLAGCAGDSADQDGPADYAELATAFRSINLVDPATPREVEDGLTVWRINLGVTNAYLIESESGLVLVDAGLPLQAGLIRRALEHTGRGDELRLIYITHAHVDHYGSAAAIRAETGAPIAIHSDDAAAMSAGESPLGQIRDWEWFSQTTIPWIERMIAILEPTTPDLVVADGDRLDEYGLDGYVLWTPGHTPGSSTLIVADRYAFAGDLVSATGDPHAQSSYAFDWPEVGESLARLQVVGPALTFAGHGSEPITADELQALDNNTSNAPIPAWSVARAP